MKRSLGKNWMGVERVFHYDPYTDESHISYHQDVEASIDRNKELQNNTDYTKHGFKREFWHYASIPPVIQMRWINEYGMHNDPMAQGNGELLFRLLNSREYRYLKATDKIHIPKGAKTV